MWRGGKDLSWYHSYRLNRQFVSTCSCWTLLQHLAQGESVSSVMPPSRTFSRNSPKMNSLCKTANYSYQLEAVEVNPENAVIYGIRNACCFSKLKFRQLLSGTGLAFSHSELWNLMLIKTIISVLMLLRCTDINRNHFSLNLV